MGDFQAKRGMHLPAANINLAISADSLVYHRAETVLRKGTLFLVVFLCSAAALLYVSIPDTETVFKEKQHVVWDLGPYAGVD